jgi:hypothetical protein
VVRTHPDPPVLSGGVAQLGERLLCKQEVIGSIPFTSTKNNMAKRFAACGSPAVNPREHK